MSQTSNALCSKGVKRSRTAEHDETTSHSKQKMAVQSNNSAIQQATLSWKTRIVSADGSATFDTIDLNNCEMDILKRGIQDIDGKWIYEPKCVVFGKPCKQRRSICFFSHYIKCYTYSNQTMCAQPLSEGLQDVLCMVNEKCGTDFNAILCNKYDDGNHYISEHRDNEKGLDNSCVASLSWGATRQFRIRNIATKETIDVPLTHGLLIRMSGTFQSMYKHGLPVEKKVNNTRISLTFRKHVVPQ